METAFKGLSAGPPALEDKGIMRKQQGRLVRHTGEVRMQTKRVLS